MSSRVVISDFDFQMGLILRDLKCRNAQLTAPWTGAKVMVPAKLIVGEQDLVYHIKGVKEYIHNGGMKNVVPLLDDVVVLEGAAHFINQEVPDEVSKHIYEFLKKF